MDQQNSNKSPNLHSETPIILSPPPLDPQQQQEQLHFQLQQQQQQPQQHMSLPPFVPASMPQGHSERQQSVGYNLQHEFETLTADLDLDLRNNLTDSSIHSKPPLEVPQPQHLPTNSLNDNHNNNNNSGLMSPSVKYGGAGAAGVLGADLLGISSSNSSSLLREAALSPIPHITSASLASLLKPNGASSFSTVNSTNNNPTPANTNVSSSTAGFLAPPPLASIPDRPQSVNDFTTIFNRNDQLNSFQSYGQPPQLQQQQQQQQVQVGQANFYSDLLVFSNWIENLNPQDNITMIDYLCNSLPLDILLTFKSRLDHHLQAPKLQPLPQQQTQPSSTQSQQQPQPQSNFGLMSPLNNSYSQELYNDIEQLNLQDSKLQQPQSQQGLQHPKPTFRASGQYLNMMDRIARPKSADPSGTGMRYGNSQQQFERSRSPTSHLYEKTNFLQLAAVNSNAPLRVYHQGTHHQDDSLDLSSHQALKLGALATINSRVALDSNRKQGHHGNTTGATWNLAMQQQQSQQQQVQSKQQQQQQQQSQQQQQTRHATSGLSRAHPVIYEDPTNRALNSSSVPANLHRTTSKSSSSKKKGPQSPPSGTLGSSNSNTSTSTLGTGGASSGTTSSSMPSEVANIELLNSIPAWLKLLRLHKYTECLKDIPWRELIELDNDELEAKGVAALGARRKLMKAFDVVKASLDENSI
ncbi:Protein VTS1 [Spathaspora sp. JA1]|nr:Protein VTS1 [Spathaspora sp. JA1]